jgi:IMP dehydrogenase/GMP reductase
MYKKQLKFDLNDIVITPIIESSIDSRLQCHPYKDDFLPVVTLPIITAPMDTVVSEKNVTKYLYNNIIVCLPRNKHKKLDDYTPNGEYSNLIFKSFGLDEIIEQLNANKNNLNYFYHYSNVLIDIANGHMSKLILTIKKIKQDYPHIKLMVGNVANPLTYKNLAMAGADYIRLGIGAGAGCLTAANTGIHYPIGSLVYECKQIKTESNLSAKIVLDGGIKNYADIIKALVIGCDYVMIGSLFNKALESAGFNYINILGKKIKIKSDLLIEFLWKLKIPIYKKYRGMSTKEVQRSFGRTKLQTSEGITKYQRVEYTLAGWTDNFKDYLRSAMSYCGAKNLDEFIGKADWEMITPESFKRFNK